MSRWCWTSILWIALAVSWPETARAEIRVEGFGVKVGGTYVSPDFQFEGEEVLDPSSLLTPFAGAFVEWSRGRRARFHVVTEVGWVRKGFDVRSTNYYADYLTVPILLRSNVRNDDTGVYIFFGPTLEFLLSADDEPVLDAYNTFALGGQAGLGLERRITRQTSLLIEFRFSSEFTNALNSSAQEPEATLESVRHRALQLSAGVRF